MGTSEGSDHARIYQQVTVHLLLSHGLTSRDGLTCDGDPCFRVNGVVSGCFKNVTPAEAARQDAAVVSSKVSSPVPLRIGLTCRAFLLSCQGPQP